MAGKKNQLNFLMKYYDKLIVVVVLIVLLISLGYLTTIAVTSEKEEAHYIERMNAFRQTSENLKPVEMKPYQTVSKLLRNPPQLATPDIKGATFLTPEFRVACEEKTCGKPIPEGAKICPFCGKEQQVLPVAREDMDTDNDGIPDKVELAWGLDPKNPDDALGDLDKDGFSNLEEYKAGTDPKDPKSHPALVDLLRVKELRAKKMPIVLSNVNRMPNGGMQLVFNESGKFPKTHFVKEGDKIGKSGYQVIKLDYKLQRRKDPKTGLPKDVNVSKATVKRLADNKEIVLVCGAPAKSTDIEAVIVFPLDNTEYKVLEKGTFQVREETFYVISVITENKTVLIKNKQTGAEKIIRRLD